MPSSISESPSSNVGLPAAGVVHELSATPNDRGPLVHLPCHRGDGSRGRALLGKSTGDLLHEHGGADAPAARRVEVVLDRHVVVDDHAGDLDVLVVGQFGGHLEVQHVACVVLHDVQHPGAAVDRPRRQEHLVRDRRGEHFARAGGVEHAVPDEPAVQGLVPGTAAGYQADLARHRAARPQDDLILHIHPQRRVRGGDAGQGVRDHGVGPVDQLLHDVAPLTGCSVRSESPGTSGARLVMAASVRTRAIPT